MMIQKVTQRKAWLIVALFVGLGLLAALTPDERLQQWGTYVLIAMFLPANYFPIFYTIAFRWWGGHLGRALFLKALGLAIVLDTALFVKFFGDAAWAEEIRFVAYALVLIGMFYQSFVMTSIRIKAGKSKPAATASKDLPGVDIN
jgi:hypothetical protein